MIILVWIAGAIYQSAYNKGRSDQQRDDARQVYERVIQAVVQEHSSCPLFSPGLWHAALAQHLAALDPAKAFTCMTTRLTISMRSSII